MLYWLYILISLPFVPNRGAMTTRRHFRFLDDPDSRKRIRQRCKLETYVRSRNPHVEWRGYNDGPIPSKRISRPILFVGIFAYSWLALSIAGKGVDNAVLEVLSRPMTEQRLLIEYGTKDPASIQRIERIWQTRGKTDLEKLHEVEAALFWTVLYP